MSRSQRGWTANDIPDQQGKLVIVTGANSGIGYEAALALAGKGAHVVLAVRNQEKGAQAVARIGEAYPNAKIDVVPLDLSDLRSVHCFADLIQRQYRSLSVLVNNAGVMAIPFRRTVDGFEMQFGTNHLGHYALTGLLLPALQATSGARVVTVTSLNHQFGTIDLDDPNSEARYGIWKAYNQSKLANVLFAYELQRRLAASGSNVASIVCHPGYAATNLQLVGPEMTGSRFYGAIFRIGNRILAQSAAMGALPILYAATAPDVVGGDFIGPKNGSRGLPVKAQSSARSHDRELAERLWNKSEELTGIHYALAAGTDTPEVRK